MLRLHLRERIECRLGVPLLPHADNGVDDQDGQDDKRLHVRAQTLLGAGLLEVRDGKGNERRTQQHLHTAPHFIRRRHMAAIVAPLPNCMHCTVDTRVLQVSRAVVSEHCWAEARRPLTSEGICANAPGNRTHSKSA